MPRAAPDRREISPVISAGRLKPAVRAVNGCCGKARFRPARAKPRSSGVDLGHQPPHLGSDMTRTAHILGNCQRAIIGSAAVYYYYRSGRTGPI
jgi:hypothetical protein